jgi:hypothetical protein
MNPPSEPCAELCERVNRGLQALGDGLNTLVTTVVVVVLVAVVLAAAPYLVVLAVAPWLESSYPPEVGSERWMREKAEEMAVTYCANADEMHDDLGFWRMDEVKNRRPAP